MYLLSQLHYGLSRSQRRWPGLSSHACSLSRKKSGFQKNVSTFVYDEIRWSGCIVVVNRKFIVIQSSGTTSAILTESNPRGGRVSVVSTSCLSQRRPNAFQSEVIPSFSE